VDSPNHNPRWPLERAVFAASIPPPGKLILLTLLAKTSGTDLDLGKWSPSTYTLAGQTGLKLDTVAKYIRLLEEHGWLTVRRHARDTNQYVLSEGKPFRATPVKGSSAAPVKGVSSRPATPTNGSTATPLNGSATPLKGSTATPFKGSHTELSPDHLSDRSDREPDPSLSGDWRDDLRIGS
jgi:DNA-binding transcriptional MocR family regulator